MARAQKAVTYLAEAINLLHLLICIVLERYKVTNSDVSMHILQVWDIDIVIRALHKSLHLWFCISSPIIPPNFGLISQLFIELDRYYCTSGQTQFSPIKLLWITWNFGWCTVHHLTKCQVNCCCLFYWHGLTLIQAWISNHVGWNYLSIPKIQRLHRWS